MEQTIATAEPNAATDAPKTLVETAYRRLRRDIIAGVYRPGEKLRVEHLKHRYEVSGSTLREALAHLVADTLVFVQGQRGFRVASISAKDFEDITHARVLLETEALRLSMANGTDVWESHVLAAYHRLSRTEEKLNGSRELLLDEYEERNREFHSALIAACPSVWIQHFLRILWQQSERYRRLSLLKHPIPRDVHKENSAILDAVLARDADRAVDLLSNHINLTLQGVRRLILDNRSARPPRRAAADIRSRKKSR